MIPVNREEFDSHELAWSAGLFDGEGWVGRYKTKRSEVRLEITQCDRRVLDRFRAAVLGIGSITGPWSDGRPNHRPKWQYQAAGAYQAQAVIAMIWRWLSPVKRDQATSAMVHANSRSAPKTMAKNWGQCERGHERNEENVRIYLYKGYECRRCRMCEREDSVRRKTGAVTWTRSRLPHDRKACRYGHSMDAAYEYGGHRRCRVCHKKGQARYLENRRLKVAHALLVAV